MRVYKLAKELEQDTGDFLEELKGNLGLEIKSHLSGLSEEQVNSIKMYFLQKIKPTVLAETISEETWKEKTEEIIEPPSDEEETKKQYQEKLAKVLKKSVETTPVVQVFERDNEKPKQQVEIEQSLFVKFLNWIRWK